MHPWVNAVLTDFQQLEVLNKLSHLWLVVVPSVFVYLLQAVAIEFCHLFIPPAIDFVTVAIEFKMFEMTK